MARVEFPQAVLLNSGGTLTASSTATVQVYDRGTTNQVTVYTTESGSTTYALPLAVSNGRIEGWVEAPASLDLDITDGGQSYTQPWEAVHSSGTGGTTTPSGWYDVTDYGAVGDGTTNDAAAIDLAVAAAVAVRGTVYFPPGTYRCTTALTTLSGISGVTFRGAGHGGTFALDLGGASVIVYDPVSSTTVPLLVVKGCHGVMFEDLTFEIGSTNVAGHLVLMNGGTWDGVFNRVNRCTFGAGTVGGSVPTGFVARGANCLALLSIGNQNRVSVKESTFIGGQRAIDTVGVKFASGVTGVAATGVFTTPSAHNLAVGRYVRFPSKTGGSSIVVDQAYPVATTPTATTFTLTGLATLGSTVTDASLHECGQTNVLDILDTDFNWQTYAPVHLDWVAQAVTINGNTFEALVDGGAAAISMQDIAAGRSGIHITGNWFGDADTSVNADWIALKYAYGVHVDGNFIGPSSAHASGSAVSMKACQGVTMSGNTFHSGTAGVRFLSNCWGTALIGNNINGMTTKVIDGIGTYAVGYSFQGNYGIANAAS